VLFIIISVRFKW